MADKKISELTAITGSNTAATDVFVVVDTSTGQTKKITREELNNAIEQDVLSTVDINGGTIDGTTIGATTAAAGSFTTVDATGNITVGGTVDGRDVAADGTKLDGIEASATADQTGAQIATALNGETISSLTALTTTGAVIVGGDFTVNGTTTTINSTTLEVDDKNIVLASGAADAAAANGSGITIDGASATFTYVSTGDKWQLNKPLDVGGTVTADGMTVQGDAYFDTNNAGRALHITRYGTVESESANFKIDDNGLIVESIQDEQYGWYLFKSTHNGVGTRNRLAISNDGDIEFYEDTGTTAKLFWDASAEALGIGTSSPASPLHVQADGVGIRLDGSADTSREIFFRNTSAANPASIHSDGALKLRAEDAGTHIEFHTADTERLRITSDGSVGIGTTSPSVQLETNNNGFGHKIEGVSVSNYTIHRFVTDTSDDNKFIIGYGASHPTVPHQIALKANNAAGTVGLYTNSSEGARLLSNRDFHVDGNVVAYSTTISDIRLKKDIAPIEDAVTKVQQLNGCTFTYLKDDRKSAGLIAQDVEKVLPSAVIEDEAVFHGEEGETYKTVQYDQVIGLLVEAVKELKAEIEELKNGTTE